MTDATITARPLDAKPEESPPFLNLFLYRVTENPQLRNVDLIERPGQVSQHSHPALSLDLHYLLTAAGTSNSEDLAAHRALGDAVLVLHNNPIISRATLASTPDWRTVSSSSRSSLSCEPR